jgi:hypothetical protein
MNGQTVILAGPSQRDLAQRLIQRAPPGAVVNIKEAKRTTEQNSKLWAMLSDISRAKPEGRCWVPETWKCAFMQSLGHQCQFAEGLDGSGPFPIGFKTSRLSKAQMADLITCIQEYGDRHGIAWSDEPSGNCTGEGE